MTLLYIAARVLVDNFGMDKVVVLRFRCNHFVTTDFWHLGFILIDEVGTILGGIGNISRSLLINHNHTCHIAKLCALQMILAVVVPVFPRY